MIEIELSTIVDNIATVQELVKLPVNARMAYRLIKICQKAVDEYNRYISVRDKIVKDVKGVIFKDGKLMVAHNQGQPVVEEDVLDGIKQQLADLGHEKVTFDVPYIEMKDIENVTMTPLSMVFLEHFIKE